MEEEWYIHWLKAYRHNVPINIAIDEYAKNSEEIKGEFGEITKVSRVGLGLTDSGAERTVLYDIINNKGTKYRVYFTLLINDEGSYVVMGHKLKD